MRRRSPEKSRSELRTDAVTSRRMAGIRQHGTAAEIAVRLQLSKLGLSYRLENRDLPGSPDLANRKKRWAVFVHGCFWHRHAGCHRATTPKRNREFWLNKFAANRRRDRARTRELRELGYTVVVLWECWSAERIQAAVSAALVVRR